MAKTENAFKKEIEIALINKEKSKGWLASKMGMSRELFWAKMNNHPKYKQFSQPEVHKIKVALSIK